jgi:phage gpG-like protein
MMAFISIQVTGNAQSDLTAILLKYKQAINTNKILDVAGAMLLNRTRARYLREVDPDNVAWMPSKAGLRRRLLGGTGTLFKSGTLFHSIQLHTDGPNGRTISTDVPYGKFHQFGQGDRLRRFLGFNGEDQVMFNRVVEDMVIRQLQAVSAAG